MSNFHVLMILTSHNVLGDTGQPTGFWLEEFTAPYYTFLDAGVTVTLASIEGGQPPLDPKSDDADAQTESTQRFSSDAAAQEALAQTLSIAQVAGAEYDALFLPGGHGTMWDFPSNASLTELIETFSREDKIIAAVCHAPAALVSAKTSTGVPLVQGKVVTAFTNSEEKGVQLESVVPFMLETRLRELGSKFVAEEDWASHIQQDGNLITGQNPASSEAAALAVIETLKKTA